MPGGAYLNISKRESNPVAERANQEGFHAAVLHYTVVPQNTALVTDDVLKEAEFCLDKIYEDAEEKGIDTERIYLVGFSAGGHLAAWSSIRFSDKIAKCILAYGAIAFRTEEMQQVMDEESFMNTGEGYSDEEIVWGKGMIRIMGEAPIDALHENVPPTFLFTTFDDEVVPYTQTLRYGSRLAELGVPCEMHIYQRGGHGLSLADESSAEKEEQIIPHVAVWFEQAVSWLKGY